VYNRGVDHLVNVVYIRLEMSGKCGECLVNVNDINELFTVDSLLYADDLKLYSRIHNMHDCIELQSNVDLLSDW
jgi:hypothetical protein